MKINQKILSIPPYISTSWKNIASISVEKKEGVALLRIVLQIGTVIEIPDLEQSVINTIFEVHGKYLEQGEVQEKKGAEDSFGFGFPLRIGTGGVTGNGLEAMGAAMQHNSEQANAPDLPPEVLNKITGIAKVLGIDDPYNLPKPEPHCNCMHCQIARALQGEDANEENPEDEVSDDDLHFRDWEIRQESDKLYIVTNPLDNKEQYNVYLGNPVGCTCGQKNCEHIRTVLNS